MARQRQVTYYKNDGSGATANFVHDGLADIPLDFIDDIGRNWYAVPEDWSRANYIFVHWNTAADDSGTAYRPGETARGVNAHVYAIWAPARQPKRGGMHFFLGSVGKAEAFRRDADGKLQLAFVSKTLTDSGLNISTTKDDIRAGEGAPIQFSFYHDSSVEVTLTDVLWKKEYLEAQLGARFTNAGSGTDYITRTVQASNNTLQLSDSTPETLAHGIFAVPGEGYYECAVQGPNLPTGEDPRVPQLVWIIEDVPFTYDASTSSPTYRGSIDGVEYWLSWKHPSGRPDLNYAWYFGGHLLEAMHQYTFVVALAGMNTQIRKMPLPSTDGDIYIVWYTMAGSDDWQAYSATGPISSIPVIAPDGTTFCVRYLGVESRAKIAEITATIIPEELFLIITAPIFAGDACAASRGKAAGHITFEIPRFQLNGAQEFAMNMSSNQTISLSGAALASAAEDCDTSAGKLLRIIEVIANEEWYTDVTSLVVDEECLAVGATPVIYAVRANGSLTRCDLRKLIWRAPGDVTYTPMTNASTFAAGVTYININNGENQGVLSTDEVVNIPEEG